MNPTFHCAFGQYISDFIQEKHTLGFPYIESGRILRCFDKFCTDNFPAEPTLSAEIGNAWAVIKPTEKSVSFQNRLGPVRELAKYMNRVGKTAYVIPPELSPKTDPPYQGCCRPQARNGSFPSIRGTISVPSLPCRQRRQTAGRGTDTRFFVPEFFSEMSGMDMNLYASLIPEVPHE